MKAPAKIPCPIAPPGIKCNSLFNPIESAYNKKREPYPIIPAKTLTVIVRAVNFWVLFL